LQATLLGIAVAIILALVAALVGPHFVDWTQYRATFETEAGKIVGLPVRIGGGIDARLLPTPTLTLGRIEIGNASRPLVRARELHVELALGSLMRGEYRASDLRLSGPELALGLSGNGKLDWPAARMGFEPERLQIEKVAIEDGRINFADAASATAASVEGFWFKGDLRSLVGPAKGEGGFTLAGERYGYRVGASRVGPDGAVKLRVGVDPTDHPLVIEADGALRLDDNAPQFDGSLTVARTATEGRGSVAVPWRTAAKVKASAARVLFEQVEYSYGPDARAIRLTGTAELQLGKSPKFESVLSARQADLDRALSLSDGTKRVPLTAIKTFVDSFSTAYAPSIPTRVGLSVDALTLGGGILQNVRGDLKRDADGWDIEKLELRAPGFAQVRLSGRVAGSADGVTFKGPAQIDATDPKSFLAWLEGRSDAAGASGTLRVGGDLTIGPQELAVERLKFEFDRKTIEGRVAYAGANGPKPPRLDAELKAAELDVDGILAFGRAALDGSAMERPRVISLTVDVGRANVAGIDVKGISGTFKLDPDGLTFDKVRVADLADAAFSLNGRMEGALAAPRGTVTFDIDARGLEGTIAVLAKYLPEAAGPLRQAAPKITPLKTKATLGIEPVSSTDQTNRRRIKLALDGTGGAMRMKAGAEASGDIATLTLPDFHFDAQVSAPDGGALITLLGLDKVVTVDKRAGLLSITTRGTSGADAQVDARLTAGGLVATAKGTARLFNQNGTAAGLDVTFAAADAGPLRRGASARSKALLPIALRARLDATAKEITLDRITGVVDSTQVRGKLTAGLGDSASFEGRIDTDSADVPALLAILSGMPKASAANEAAWSGEPFGDALFKDLKGEIFVSAGRAALSPQLVGRDVRAVVRVGAGEITVDNVEGALAGGRASAKLTLRRSPEGMTARGHVTLQNADATQMLTGEGRPAISGRVAIAADFEGSGLSPASLVGALSGAGTVTLEDAQLSGLDPKAFGAAIGAVDRGLAIDAPKIRDIVATVLDGGGLSVPRLDAPFTINAGQARIAQTLAYGQGADLVFAAGSDIADWSIDARLTLLGPSISEGGNATRPEILVTLKGAPGAPRRNVDVSTLSGFLMLRSVERQSRRIDTMEAERREAERRENERREAERHERERRESEARAVTAPAALPSQPVATEEAAPPAGRAPRPATPQAQPAAPVQAPAQNRAPALPPPLNIGPAPGNRSGQSSGAGGPTAAKSSPPSQPRSALEMLFGVQR
jgi:large subunit ribosomal protein L24